MLAAREWRTMGWVAMPLDTMPGREVTAPLHSSPGIFTGTDSRNCLQIVLQTDNDQAITHSKQGIMLHFRGQL